MKRKLIFLCTLGFSVGIIIGIAINAFTAALSKNDGSFYLCDPALVDRFGGEINAYVFELIICGFFGSFAMGGSIVYHIDKWSILKATIVHFVMVTVGYIVVGITMGWVEPRLCLENFIMLCIFVVAYAVVWLIISFIYKNEVDDINEGLERMKQEESREEEMIGEETENP